MQPKHPHQKSKELTIAVQHQGEDRATSGKICCSRMSRTKILRPQHPTWLGRLQQEKQEQSKEG